MLRFKGLLKRYLVVAGLGFAGAFIIISSNSAKSANFLVGDLQSQSEKTENIINQFRSQLSQLPAFEMSFSMNYDGQVSVGTVQAQKDFYRMDNKDLSLYCDGDSKWIYNVANNEVIILKNDLSQVDLLENPLAFFYSLGKGYSYPEKVKSSNVNKVPVWVVDLFPINKRLGYSKISLMVDKRNYSPVRIVYVMKSGEVVTVDITSFSEKKPWGKDHFRFDTAKHNGLRVSDMR
ncbi:MAG: outer membrane lipoprotein carrier protein LolA [Bacteroidales bacterium]|jgi:outer membrane lipoprotein-sorting protein|nr:outer membrane lipoprotein carrier protein LolA [Bacteroidales bacterium]